MNIAHVCTPHGLGHVTRQIALAVSLQKYGCQSTFFCHNPSLVHESLPDCKVVQKFADVGIIQSKTTKVDIDQTLSLLNERCSPQAIDEWVDILQMYQLVIADIPPLIFAAAQKANVPVLGIGNFDWVWIYQHFTRLKQWSETMRKWQSGHHAVQLHPGHSLHCSIRAHAHWLARETRPSPYSLPSLSILVGLGGLSEEEIQHLPCIEHVYWILSTPKTLVEREDIKYIPNIPFPSLVKTVDIVFSKAGYGILAESQVAGTPQIWMKRTSFPEARILESFAQSKGDFVIQSPWGTKSWKDELRQGIHSLKNNRRLPQQNDSHRLAQWIVQTYCSSHAKEHKNSPQSNDNRKKNK